MNDSKERKLIIESLNENYFVEASAGSGKTTSLVYRMVALVESGVSIDKICTITFTKAAADEFFARFQKLLSLRSVLNPPSDSNDDSDNFLGKRNEHTVKMCQEALANIDSCFLGTIDSFLNMVAHEMPHEIKIPSDAEVISDDIRKEYIKLYYEDLISTVSDDPLHMYALKFHNAVNNAYDWFIVGVEIVSNNRDSIIDYDHDLCDVDLEEYLRNEKKNLLNVANLVANTDYSFSGEKNKKTKREIKYLYNRIKNDNLNDNLKNLARIIKLLSGLNKYPIKEVRGTKLEDIMVEATKSSFTYNEETLKLLKEIDRKINDYIHSLFFTLSIGAEARVNEILKREGKFSYNDFLYYVKDAFKKSASTDRVLVNHIYSRHSYFLLDENQDTNPIQTELFFYLAGIDYQSDWTKINLRPGSIFIVGDPKQSIYGFRGANVKAYLKTKEAFYSLDDKKNRVLLLTSNFRSNKRLKEWFNLSMDNILNHDKDALRHNDIPIDDKDYPFINSLDKDDILYDGEYKYLVNPKQDPIYVAQLIYKLVNDKHHKIIEVTRDKSGNKFNRYRSVNYQDFLIVPVVTNVMDYVEAFTSYNIPFILEAQVPFDRSESLMHIIDLVKLFKSPNDKGLLLKVLTGQLYEFSDQDVLSLINKGFNLDISDISMLEDINDIYVDALCELNRLYKLTYHLSVSSSMLLILEDISFKLLKRCSSEYLEYTYFVIEKVKEQEEAGHLNNINELTTFLSRFLKKNKEDSRVLRFKDKVDRVKIANLHKVKGLEAPIVILIKPRKMLNEPNSYIDYSENTPKVYYSGITSAKENDRTMIAKTSRYDDVTKADWLNYANAENDRLQYVAATRAKSVLIVSYYEGDSRFTNAWGKLIEYIHDEVPSFDEFDPNPVEEVDTSYNESNINVATHKPSRKYHTPSTGRVHRVTHNDDVIYEEELDATTLGTLVHKLMECLVSSKNEYKDIDKLIVFITNQYYEGELYISKLKYVATTMLNGGYIQKNSSLSNDLLKTLENAKQVICEMPYSYLEHNVVVTGIIDILYIDEEGNYHVIDYKTNKEDDVSVLEKEYEKQLKDYVEALEKIGINADAHIYHIEVK